MSQRKRLVVTHVHANNINIGDEAINYSLYRLLEEFEPCYLDISNYSDGYPGIVDRCNDGALSKCFKLILKSDLVVFGPGDVITDWSFTYKCMALAVVLGKPVACLGVGVNFTRTTLLQRFVFSQVLKACRLFIVRDRKSYDLLLSLGVAPRKLKLSCDIFFSNAASHLATLAKPEPPYLVVSLRAMEFNSKCWGSDCYDEIARSLDYLVERYGFAVKLLPMLSARRNLRRPNMLPDDDRVLHEVYCRSRHEDRLELLTEVDSYQQAMQIIAHAQFVVATRLHTMIMATCASVPFIGLSYSVKTDSYCIDNRLEEFMVDIGHLESAQVNAIADRIMEDYAGAKLRFVRAYRNNLDLSSVYHREVRALALGLSPEVVAPRASAQRESR